MQSKTQMFWTVMPSLIFHDRLTHQYHSMKQAADERFTNTPLSFSGNSRRFVCGSASPELGKNLLE